MSGPRIALVALTTSGAAGDYVTALGRALAQRTAVAMWIPDRPPLAVDTEAHFIQKAPSRAGVAAAETAAWVRHSGLADQVHGWGPDVVHIVFGEGYPTAARAATTLAARGVTVAATWHDPLSHGQVFDRIQHAVAARTMRAAAGIHVHCDALVPRGFAADVLVSELPAFPCPSCPGVTTTEGLRTEGTIAMVGRFAPYKGVDQMCRALEGYWRRGGERRFVVVGQGRVPSSLRRLQTSWPGLVSIENVYVSGERLHGVLSAAAVCVMPYRTGTQSALPWLARSHGAHLVATDVGCIGEVTRRIGGCVVAPLSAEALTEALLQPPGEWTDVAHLAMPTFDTLAGRLIAWYPTLSAS